MEFAMNPYIVYAKTDSGGYITAVNSSAFLTDTAGWTEIDRGFGDKFHHAQGNYLPSPLLTDDGICRWKWENKRCVLRTDGEIDAERAAMPKPPLSDIEKLEKKIAAQNELLDFYENCIAEMAEIVYA